MRLRDRVHVARRFQRSIRIDTDLSDPKALEGFVCPQSSADVLLDMSRHVVEKGQGAFTWTGPYGSGKSSLAVALSAALCGDLTIRSQAATILGRELVEPLWNALPPRKRGWRILPVMGQRAAPAEIIGQALVAQGFIPKGEVRRWTDDRVLASLTAIAGERPSSFGGLILFLDEMGKILEGTAQERFDIFLFQRLAEAAARSNGRLLVVGILHQAFDEYAQRLARDLRDEWAKVHGRYLDLVVSTVGDEQLDLLARAIQVDQPAARPSEASEVVAEVVRASRPSAAPDLATTFEHCWPLHPVVAGLLGPISRRRFGQNQRSLFGFLNSSEPFGFQDFLRDAEDGDLLLPDQLWEYLRVNLESAILASPDGHRWSMAVEAIERSEASGAAQTHQKLLKSIAVVDLFRERSGLRATSRLLATCVPDESRTGVEEALEQLKAWSLVVYRKHLGAYAVYAGSDFDIEQALTEALNATREVDFGTLRAFAGLQPILAKRHYHRTGALRWFDVDLVPLAELASYSASEGGEAGATGRFLLAVPTANESQAAASAICQEVAEQQSATPTVVGFSTASWQVMELAREFLALTKISVERTELSGDLVARREVFARLSDARARLESDLHAMFDSAEWHQGGHSPRRLSYPELNTLASDLADARFPKAPSLSNELLNRERPSSNAISAQRALLKLMVQREGDPRLGIAGYPAEGGLFDSILLRASVYRLTSQGWKFSAPAEGADPCNLLPAWESAVALLEAHADRPVAVSELYELWRAPPFGIKGGLLPVLTVSLLLSRADRLAFYREGIFQARFTDLDVDYLTRDPASIQLRWMTLTVTSRTILSELAAVVRELDGGNPLVHLEPIHVARGLVGIVMGLRPWVTRTNQLSANAVRVRTLFKKASDPNKFLFDDIQSLFGDTASRAEESAIENIISRVREGLHELTEAYPKMLGRLQDMLLTELQVPNASAHALEELRSRATNVRQLTGDFRLNAFVTRLLQFTGSQSDMEGIASLAMNKPPRDWVDADLDHARVEIAEMAQKFVHSEAFARVKGRADKRQAMSVVVGIDGRPAPVSGEFAIRDTDRPAVEALIARMEKALGGEGRGRRDIVLAALAELSARYLVAEAPDAGSSPLSRKVAKK